LRFVTIKRANEKAVPDDPDHWIFGVLMTRPFTTNAIFPTLFW
jgi:hypothetical protein